VTSSNSLQSTASPGILNPVAGTRAFYEERDRLVREYAAATQLYSKAARRLKTLSGEQFTKALKESEAARRECTKARSAIMWHKTEHGY
jgi:hypothetical protein